jgi:HEAT repeat protein
VRAEALRALGRIGGGDAERGVLAAFANEEPWVREVAVEQAGRFRDDATVAERLRETYQNDGAYRVRETALASLGQVKAGGAMETLDAAARTDSPDDVIRRAALRAMGPLGDNKAVPTLLDWSAQGKPSLMREAAITSLGQLDKKNSAVESRLISYLDEPDFDIRLATLIALGERDDSAAIAPIEAMSRRPDVPESLAPYIDRALARLRHTGDTQGDAGN